MGGRPAADRDLAPFTLSGGLIDAATLAPFDGWWGLGATEAAALGLSATWSCVTLLCDAIAGRRWVERRGIEELAPSRIVRRPAASMTRRRWTWRVVASLALYNRCPLWMIGGIDDEGVPGSLLPIAPDLVQPLEPIDPYGIVDPTRYSIGSTEVSAEEIYTIFRAELPSIAPRDAALLQLARRVFRQAIAADIGATRYWTSGGSPTTVLTTDQEVDTAQAAAIANRWLERRGQGPDYPAVLGKGAHAEPYGADPTTESGVESRRELVADVARLFRVPRRLVNAPGTDTGTYANAQDDGLDLVRYTLAGYADPIADAISDLLPGDYLTGRRVEIDLSELTRAGQGDRYAAWRLAIGSAPVESPDDIAPDGWMSRNEVRIAEGLAPIPPGSSGEPAAGPGAVDVNPGADSAGGQVEPVAGDPGATGAAPMMTPAPPAAVAVGGIP